MLTRFYQGYKKNLTPLTVFKLHRCIKNMLWLILYQIVQTCIACMMVHILSTKNASYYHWIFSYQCINVWEHMTFYFQMSVSFISIMYTTTMATLCSNGFPKSHLYLLQYLGLDKWYCFLVIQRTCQKI